MHTINAHIVEGSVLNLTTPVAKDTDTVFPGEGWFFYWKTSSSLWKSKIEEIHEGNLLIVPLNWGFHSETGDEIDFADNRPETNLKKLVEIAFELNKEVIFLLPMSPAPFLVNGGVPQLLAKDLAADKNGFHYTVVDPEGNLNKIYSFFNPTIFKKWSFFVSKLSRYFSEQGIACDVKGLDCGYFENNSYHSYIEDYSATFEVAFSDFLNAKKEELGEENFHIQNKEEEKIYRKEFTDTISQHYFRFAARNLAANWTGVIKSSFLGGELKDNLNRLGNVLNEQKNITDLLLSVSENVIPSSTLLPMNSKRGAFDKVLNDLIDYNYKKSIFVHSFQEEEEANLRPLSFFIIEDDIDVATGKSLWDQYNFWEFIHSQFGWAFQKRQIESIDFDEENLDLEKIYCFTGENFDEKTFRNVLKIFMLGGIILLDRNQLEKKLIQRLEAFLIENSLEVEKVNYHTEVHNISLGTGRLVVFNGYKLGELNADKKIDFWSKVFSTFDIVKLPIHIDSDVNYVWRTRMSTPSELSYQEVRRLGLYNSTEDKKRIVIPHQKNFALKKIIDELEASVTTKNSEIEVTLMPGGSVSLDFGVFS